jgi:hypothetical protein
VLINKSKLAMVFKLAISAGLNGIFFFSKKSQGYFFSIDHDSRPPFLSFLEPIYARTTRSIMCENSMISMVLRRCTSAKIFKSAIQSIPVLMVDMRSICLEYLSMHRYAMRLPNSSSPCSIKTFVAVVVFGVPVPLHQPDIDNSINNRYLPSRQGDISNGWIIRLGDNWARFRFCHEMILSNSAGGI